MLTLRMPDGAALTIDEHGVVGGDDGWAAAYAHEAQAKVEVRDDFYGTVTCGDGATAAYVWALFWGAELVSGEPPEMPAEQDGWIA